MEQEGILRFGRVVDMEMEGTLLFGRVFDMWQAFQQGYLPYCYWHLLNISDAVHTLYMMVMGFLSDSCLTPYWNCSKDSGSVVCTYVFTGRRPDGVLYGWTTTITLEPEHEPSFEPVDITTFEASVVINYFGTDFSFTFSNLKFEHCQDLILNCTVETEPLLHSLIVMLTDVQARLDAEFKARSQAMNEERVESVESVVSEEGDSMQEVAKILLLMKAEHVVCGEADSMEDAGETY